MDIWKIISENWFWIIIVFLGVVFVLIFLLYRNYDIDEITPPFIKFKRKTNVAKSEISQGIKSIAVKKNTMWGKNKIIVRREDNEVSDNNMIGENEIEIGTKPGPKPKKVRKKS